MCAIIHLNIYINNINLLGIYTLSKIQVKCHFLHISPPRSSQKMEQSHRLLAITLHLVCIILTYYIPLFLSSLRAILSSSSINSQTQHNPFFACRGSKGIHIKFKCTFFLLISLKKGNFLHQNLIAIVDMHNFHGTHT